MSSLLKSLGINHQDIEEAVETLRFFYNPKSLKIGQEISAEIHTSPDHFQKKRLQSLIVKTSPSTEIFVERHIRDNYLVSEKEIDFEKQLGFAQGAIESSLFETSQKMGIPSEATSEIFHALSYDVDFERDIQGGNNFKVVFERYYYLNGEFSHFGKILYASLELNDQTLNIYRHTLASGDQEYFMEDGTGVKKALMKTPIPSARVTSNFGMRRHPISIYTRLHKGVDFRAPRGTPIMAAGNGTISFQGRNGGYGNYLMIRHNATYTTAYAHILRFAPGLRKGSRVKQGDIVAYVGSTGRATGPHLHYEVLINGQRVNPLSIKSTPGSRLKGKELESFGIFKQSIHQFLENSRNESMAGEVTKNFKGTSAPKTAT